MIGEKDVYIYKLVDPITKSIRYIGKTNNLKRRLQSHIDVANTIKSKRYVCNWINSLKEKGLRPEMEVVEICTIENWVGRETYWIAYYRSIGIDLCNLTDGGESNTGYVYSDELKKIRSEARMGKQIPKEVKTKIAETLCKKVVDSTGIAFNSMKEAVKISGVPKSTFHRKLHRGELINGKQYKYVHAD